MSKIDALALADQINLNIRLRIDDEQINEMARLILEEAAKVCIEADETGTGMGESLAAAIREIKP